MFIYHASTLLYAYTHKEIEYIVSENMYVTETYME